MSIDHLLSQKKSPTSKRKYVGIEIECLIPYNTRRKLELLLLKDELQWNVHLGGDSSIVDTDFIPEYRQEQRTWSNYPQTVIANEHERWDGVELRILAEEEEGPEIIDKVCKALAKVKAKVNKTCGLHVHVDVRSRDSEMVFNNLFFFQDFMLQTQPKDRRTSKFCKRLSRKYKDPKERYYLINKRAYKEHRTLEVRLHEASIDAKEIKMWSGFLIKVANLDYKLDRQVGTIDRFQFPDALKEYMYGRIKKYA